MGCGQGSKKSEFRVQECVCPRAGGTAGHTGCCRRRQITGYRCRALHKGHTDGIVCDQQLQVLVVTVTETGLSVHRGTAAGEQFERA